MTGTQYKEDEELTHRACESQTVVHLSQTPHSPADIGGTPKHAALSLAAGGLAGRSNMTVRAQAIHQIQGTHGNRAVQRYTSHSALPVQRETTLTQEEIKENVGKGTAALDLGKQTAELAMGDAMPKGYGLGMG